MSKDILYTAFLLFLSISLIGGGKPRYPQLEADSPQLLYEHEPVFTSASDGNIKKDLEDAINNVEDRSSEENGLQWLDRTSDSIESALEEAMMDDAQVPSSMDNSNDFVDLTESAEEYDKKGKYQTLERVANNLIPPDITVEDYTATDNIKLIRLYQSKRSEDLRELFEYVAGHVHNKYRNCILNFASWVTNRRSDQPIFYRNCVPCTNAVDLNLQSLFDQHINIHKLKHYFVNTCDMGKEWISYISDMEYLPVLSTFTDVIKQDLLPNQRFSLKMIQRFHLIVEFCRYVVRGRVRSEGLSHREFFHVCNLITNESGHIWMIDGQTQQVFDFNQTSDIEFLNRRYRSDYVARASTGLFRPPPLVE